MRVLLLLLLVVRRGWRCSDSSWLMRYLLYGLIDNTACHTDELIRQRETACWRTGRTGIGRWFGFPWCLTICTALCWHIHVRFGRCGGHGHDTVVVVILKVSRREATFQIVHHLGYPFRMARQMNLSRTARQARPRVSTCLVVGVCYQAKS